ncbi:MAG: LapA family protein [Pseudomonadota bacterium]
MRVLFLLLKLVLFLLLLAFAVKNSDTVVLRYLLGLEWRAPLSLILLSVFAVGVLTGLLGCAWQRFGLRKAPRDPRAGAA